VTVEIDHDVVSQATSALRAAIDTLNSCIDNVVSVIAEDRDKNEYDRDLVVHLAWLTHQVIQILAEIKMLDHTKAAGGGRSGGSLTDRFKSA